MSARDTAYSTTPGKAGLETQILAGSHAALVVGIQVIQLIQFAQATRYWSHHEQGACILPVSCLHGISDESVSRFSCTYRQGMVREWWCQGLWSSSAISSSQQSLSPAKGRGDVQQMDVASQQPSCIGNTALSLTISAVTRQRTPIFHVDRA